MRFYRFVRFIIGVYVRVFYRVEYYGRENEPQNGGYIAFSNHSTFIDPAFIACAVKRPLFFMAKSDLEKHAVLRWFFEHCNVVPVHRGESDIGALKKTCEIVSRGDCVGIYPQGTRVPCDSPDPETAQAGIGLMAMRTKAVLLPITVCYGKKNKKPMLFRKVKVYIGKPITYDEYSSIGDRPSSREIANYAFSKLCETFNEKNHG